MCFRQKRDYFKEGELKMKEEMCILNLLQVITKLKAAIAVLVGDDCHVIQ
jgi:hypothetical protein